MPALTTMRLIAVEGSPLSAISWARVGIDTRVLAINGEEESASGLSISMQPTSTWESVCLEGQQLCARSEIALVRHPSLYDVCADEEDIIVVFCVLLSLKK